MQSKPPRLHARGEGNFAKMVAKLDARYDGLKFPPPSQPEGRPIVATSSRRARGKVRGNKKNPRTFVVAYESCREYASQDDYDNGNIKRFMVKERKVAGKPNKARKTFDKAVAAQALHTRRTSEGHVSVTSVKGTRSMDEIRRLNGLT